MERVNPLEAFFFFDVRMQILFLFSCLSLCFLRFLQRWLFVLMSLISPDTVIKHTYEVYQLSKLYILL